MTISELTRVFLRIGLLSFGGPAAQIALMHREIVDDRKWVTEQEYLSALSFCMLLPGPEAMQLATWIGWRKHGTLGGLIAGGLFVLPGAIVVLALSMTYAAWGQVPVVAALFTGVQAAVLAVVIEALLRVSKRALKSQTNWIIAIAAFCAPVFVCSSLPGDHSGRWHLGFCQNPHHNCCCGNGPRTLARKPAGGFDMGGDLAAAFGLSTADAPRYSG